MEYTLRATMLLGWAGEIYVVQCLSKIPPSPEPYTPLSHYVWSHLEAGQSQHNTQYTAGE